MGKVKSYHIKAESKIFSGESSQVYQVEQWYQEPDSYRLEIKDEDSEQILISTGGETWIYHSEMEDYYSLNSTDEDETQPPYLLTVFWENLINAAEIEILGKENISQGKVYLLRVTPGVQEVHWHTEKVWLDDKNFIPWKVEVYDDQGSPRLVFQYEEAVLNQEVDSGLFIVERSQKEAVTQCEATNLSLDEAREKFPYPVLLPVFLPEGADLKLVTVNQEPSFISLILNYRGPKPFSIVQQALFRREEKTVEAGSDVYDGSEVSKGLQGTEELKIGNISVYFREDPGVKTLYWSSEEVRYFITGEIEMEQMLELAASMIK